MRSLLSDGLALLIIQDAGIPVKARVLGDAGNPYDGAEQKMRKTPDRIKHSVRRYRF